MQLAFRRRKHQQATWAPKGSWLLSALVVVAALLQPTVAATFPPIGTFYGIPGQNATYEYVIVGGGTSGLTVGARLAEAGHSVAIVEAGSFYEFTNGNISQIPAYGTRGGSAKVTDIQPLVDWGFITTPQPGLGGRLLHYAQGKTLGGSSARNIMAYHRGTRSSYDLWAQMVGDDSFKWDNFLPYFKRSVQFTPPNYSKLPPGTNISYDGNAFDRNGGPLQLTYSNYEQPFTSGIRTGMDKLNLSSIPGLNSGNLIGYAQCTFTIDPATQIRSSSETSFLQDAVNKQSPFTVYVQTAAKNILFDSQKRANAVVVNSGGLSYTLNATKEVIVAAGTFKTPQLLMVSGVGPASTLQGLGISVVSNLQGVGQNVWDQPLYSVGFKTNVTTNQALNDPATLYKANADFVNTQTGPLTSPGVDIIGWEKIPAKYRSRFSASAINDLKGFPGDWPEIELLPLASATFPVSDKANYASINIVDVAPLSRGNVSINSTDTNSPPLISPNWLTSTTDQQVAVQSVRVARDLLAGSGLMVGPEIVPGPSVQTDAQILDYLRQTSTTIHHAVASCKMGASSDRMAVVDTLGRVYGVSKLRIVDASTFPILPPGHCQATVYALAEKFAASILAGN